MTLKEVFMKERKSLLLRARRQLRNKELAEDAIQDLYLRIAGHTEELENPLAYVRQTLRRICMNKKRTGNTGYIAKSHVPLTEAPEGAYEMDVEQLDYLKLYEAIGQLPRKQKAVIIATMTGISSFEYARKNGLNKQTAHANYKHGMKRLREILEAA